MVWQVSLLHNYGLASIPLLTKGSCVYSTSCTHERGTCLIVTNAGKESEVCLVLYADCIISVLTCTMQFEVRSGTIALTTHACSGLIGNLRFDQSHLLNLKPQYSYENFPPDNLTCNLINYYSYMHINMQFHQAKVRVSVFLQHLWSSYCSDLFLAHYCSWSTSEFSIIGAPQEKQMGCFNSQ